jgi:nitrilase
MARYDKIHLFDVELSAKESYRESDTNLPGSELVLVNTPVGKIGMSVCFDVRFPEMYRELHRQGAEILVIPSAFTLPTGRAHWEILVRARAIENFAYVIAAAQVGVHGQGRKTYGHSMIVAPTGEIIATQPADPGVITAEINLALNLKRPCLPDH